MKNIFKENSKKYSIINFFINLFGIVAKVYDKFQKDAGYARAGGLAFNTLLAAVPFVALVISMLNAFGVLASIENQVMDFILNLLIPTRQGQAANLIKTFLNNSNKLGVIGLIFFAITSIMLLNTVSVNLNAIWGSRTKNNFIKKFTTYTSVIFFGTLFWAASTTITSRFNLFTIENIPAINLVIIKTAPFIFNFLVILLIIGMVPSGKIKVKYLFFVSFLGASFWEILKFAFFNVSSTFIRMSVIYGAIAIIPIFLFWVYIIWIIIILALEIAWVLQYNNKTDVSNDKLYRLPGEEINFSFSLFISVALSFYKGNKAPSIDELADEFSTTPNITTESLLSLESCGFIIRNGEKPFGWIPSKSLSIITTNDILNALIGPYATNKETASLLLKDFFKSGFSGIKNESIADYLKKIETPNNDASLSK